jgi:DNA gyrase subunit A
VIEGDELIMITQNGVTIRTRISDIRVISRATQGVKIIALDEGDRLVSVARNLEEPGDEGDAPEGNGNEQTNLLPEK